MSALRSLSLVSLALAVSDLSAQTRTIAERLGHPANAKLLLLHADDLGVARSVNAASFDALEKGAVSSASAMVPTPFFSEVAAYFRAHPDVDLGLHLTLIAEWDSRRRPIAPPDSVPSLIDSTGFLWGGPGIVRAQATATDVERELRAQVERALALGLRPTHLDSHGGATFVTADIFAAYVKVAHAYRLPFFAMRAPGDTGRLKPPFAERDIVVDAVVMAGANVRRDQLKDFYLTALRNMKPGLTKMIVHPGRDDAELRAISAGQEVVGSAWRQRDYDIVTSAEFRKALQENNIILVRWKDLGKLVY